MPDTNLPRAKHNYKRDLVRRMRADVAQDPAAAAIKWTSQEVKDAYGAGGDGFQQARDSLDAASGYLTAEKADYVAAEGALNEAFAGLPEAMNAMEGLTRSLYGAENTALMPKSLLGQMQSIYRHGDMKTRKQLLGNLGRMGRQSQEAIKSLSGRDDSYSLNMMFIANALAEGREQDANTLLEGQAAWDAGRMISDYSSGNIDTALARGRFVAQYGLSQKRAREIRKGINLYLMGQQGFTSDKSEYEPSEWELHRALESVAGPQFPNPAGYLTEKPSYLSKEFLEHIDDYLDEEEILSMLAEQGGAEGFFGVPLEDAIDIVDDGVWHPIGDGVYLVFQPPGSVDEDSDGRARVLQVQGRDGEARPFVLSLQGIKERPRPKLTFEGVETDRNRPHGDPLDDSPLLKYLENPEVFGGRMDGSKFGG